MLQQAKTWIVIGVAGAVVILALGWLFVINPQTSKTNSANSQASAENLTILQNQHKLATLRQQNANLATYQAAVAADKLALPSDDGIPDFLRATQAIGVATGVAVSSISVSTPTSSAANSTSGTAPANGVFEVDLSMVASGPAKSITAFLKQLQTGQPRAVVITVASVAASPTGQTLTLTFKVFIQPASS